MSSSLVIAGTGLITPLGHTTEANWRSLLAGECIVDHGRVNPRACGATHDRVTALAEIAAREAIARADWDASLLSSDRTALVVGTSKGAIDDWITSDKPPPGFRSTSTGEAPVPLGCHVSGGLGLHTVDLGIAQRLRLGYGPRLTISSACATGLIALIRAALLLRHGDADRALIVAAESSLHPALIASYGRLGVLVRKNELVRPFDLSRSGFLVGEAAAAVCLERAELRTGQVAIEQFALGCDATHLTGTNPRARALRACLGQCLKGGSTDLVHAHGTGTEMNDAIELEAIESVVADGQPHIYSHKGALGHTLGAAGLISVVLNVRMHQIQKVLPNANTLRPLPVTRVKLSSDPFARNIRRSICVAAGFGGAIGVMSLRSD